MQYSGLISQLNDKARSTVRDLDPTNDLTFLRIRSKKHEIMVAPGEYDPCGGGGGTGGTAELYGV